MRSRLDDDRVRSARPAPGVRGRPALRRPGPGPDDHAAERRTFPTTSGQTWRDRFFVEYERQFHSVTRDIAIEIAALRVRGTRATERPDIPFRATAAAPRWDEREVLTDSAA